jgi:hypothetical protein
LLMQDSYAPSAPQPKIQEATQWATGPPAKDVAK